MGAVVFSRSATLPPAFTDARSHAASVSKKIVELTTATHEKITTIHGLDEQGNVNRARAVVRDARALNQEAYQNAFTLSQDLQALAQSLGQISSQYDQRVVYEAVAVELSLVSEFIVYTRDLNGFLERVDQAIETNTTQDRRAVEDSLARVNEKVNRINQLNQEFLSKMKIFDKAF